MCEQGPPQGGLCCFMKKKQSEQTQDYFYYYGNFIVTNVFTYQIIIVFFPVFFSDITKKSLHLKKH